MPITSITSYDWPNPQGKRPTPVWTTWGGRPLPLFPDTRKALMYCQAGVARSGASRSAYCSPKTFLSIAGVQRATTTAAGGVFLESLTISDVLNETPNTCGFTADGFRPSPGQEVIVTLGSINNLNRLFAGHILEVTTQYVGQKPANTVYQVRAIDYTWQFNRKLVTKQYLNQSATAIAQDLVTSFTTGFSVSGIQLGLPTVDEITFTDVSVMDAITRLAARIGGYGFVDYRKTLWLYTTDPPLTNPRPVTPAHPTLTTFEIARDVSQEVTRVRVEGGGSTALAAVAIGETIIPLTDGVWYNAGGGTVAAGPQRVTYTGLFVGGGGVLVGPGIAPAGAPALALAAGTGIELGAHGYAYTFVTAAGESLPSPTASVTTASTLPAPSTAPNYNGGQSGGAQTDGYYGYAFTFVTASGETTPSPVQPIHTLAALGVNLKDIVAGLSGVTARKLYRTTVQATGALASTAQLKLLATISDNTTTTYSDVLGDGSLGANAPTSNTAGAGQQVAVTAIATGQASVTSRKLYRTAAGASQLKLVTTIADNTTTTYTDSLADGSLGANVPTGDTSGLTQPTGQVIAGSTTLLTAGAGAFSPTGGWAVIGNGTQIIRYTGISGNTLTGIPASGDGSITATISYNSTITAAAALTGIPTSGTGAIVVAIKKGDEIDVIAQADDAAAQAVLVATIGGSEDGIVEDSLQDRRLSYTEALARARAQLALKAAVQTSISYSTRDLNTQAGRTIWAALPPLMTASASFKIQEVTISNFLPNVFPTYRAMASSTRYSFEDLIRQFRGTN